MTVADYPCVLQNALIEIIDMQPTAYNVDNVLERLKKASYERFGNTGMGGELVVNLDDAIKVIRTRELNCDETQEIRTVLKHTDDVASKWRI